MTEGETPAETARYVTLQNANRARALADRCPDDHFAEQIRQLAERFEDCADHLQEESSDG